MDLPKSTKKYSVIMMFTVKGHCGSIIYSATTQNTLEKVLEDIDNRCDDDIRAFRDVFKSFLRKNSYKEIIHASTSPYSAFIKISDVYIPERQIGGFLRRPQRLTRSYKCSHIKLYGDIIFWVTLFKEDETLKMTNCKNYIYSASHTTDRLAFYKTVQRRLMGDIRKKAPYINESYDIDLYISKDIHDKIPVSEEHLNEFTNVEIEEYNPRGPMIGSLIIKKHKHVFPFHDTSEEEIIKIVV
jgi:hypothetical protein